MKRYDDANPRRSYADTAGSYADPAIRYADTAGSYAEASCQALVPGGSSTSASPISTTAASSVAMVRSNR
jgi:hypothetical protein